MKNIFAIFYILFGFLRGEMVEIKSSQSSNGAHRDDIKSVVIDYKSKLMWQDDKNAKTLVLDWYGAKKYCETLSLGGFYDWRLPARSELFGITDDSRSFPSLRSEFTNFQSGAYVSSTSCAGDSYKVWNIYFDYGHGDCEYSKVDNSYVRCVRDVK